MGICVHPPMLVMELMPRGSVYDIIYDVNKQVHWSMIYKFAFDAAKGMTRLHSEAILHRDLKSKNLLVDQNWAVKVADFGLSGLKVRSPEQGNVIFGIKYCRNLSSHARLSAPVGYNIISVVQCAELYPSLQLR